MIVTSLDQIVSNSAELFSSRSALILDNRTVTYIQLEKVVQALAKLFEKHLLGNPIAILVDQDEDFVVSLLAVSRCKRVAIPITTKIATRNLNHIINETGCDSIITSHTVAKRVLSEITEFQPFEQFNLSSEGINLVLLRSSRINKNEPRLLENTGLVLYTSGTTKQPIGIPLLHTQFLAKLNSIGQRIEFYPTDISLLLTPLSFIQSLWVMFCHLSVGGSIVLGRKFSSKEFLCCVKDHQITTFSGVPTMYRRLLIELNVLPKNDMDSLRLLMTGGDINTPVMIYQIREMFPRAALYNIYGTTETCAADIIIGPPEIDIYPNSIGKPTSNVEVKLVNDRGEAAELGETAEIYISSPYMARSYLNEQHIADTQGFFHTGDLGIQDKDGFIYLKGRRTHLIMRNGTRISPEEVEAIIAEIPGISEVAVIGIPDEEHGESIAAYIVRTEASDVTSDDILKVCRSSLEPYKVPTIIEFRQELPRTISQKLQRHLLMPS